MQYELICLDVFFGSKTYLVGMQEHVKEAIHNMTQDIYTDTKTAVDGESFFCFCGPIYRPID